MTTRTKAILAVITGNTIFGFNFIFSKMALQITVPSVLIAVRFLTAVISIIAGVVFLHESFSLFQAAGAVIIIGSVYIANRRPDPDELFPAEYGRSDPPREAAPDPGGLEEQDSSQERGSSAKEKA